MQMRRLFGCFARSLIILALFASGQFAYAATSEVATGPAVEARLISVEDGVAPGTRALSLGLDLQLAEGWKTYWRSPGEVGIPPSIDWAGSENLTTAEMLWPAPKRFTAFGIENFGYQDRVVFPIRVETTTPGAAVNLQAQVNLLVCSEVCVPQDFLLTLDIPAGVGIDQSSADLITAFADRVPLEPATSNIVLESAALSDDATSLIVTARSAVAFTEPDVFPEMGSRFTFGRPDIRLGDNGRSLWAELPILSAADDTPDLQMTITDSDRAVTGAMDLSASVPAPPFTIAAVLPDFAQVLSIVLIAFAGGAILNVMPCVLPVLSIKVSSAIAARGQSDRTLRMGFLFSALGVMVFMWVLALAVLALKAFGVSVGWGLQFQNPVFLTFMFFILAAFSANLFGAFEFTLPADLQTQLADTGKGKGHWGDFSTGAFAALMATPCSAPLLGTALAFALTGRPIDVVAVFTALGVGLALPYFAFALRPGWINLLPRPGRWMIVVKVILGILLFLTALWLLWVLSGVAGQMAALAVLIPTLIVIAIVTMWSKASGRGPWVLLALGLVPTIAASSLAVDDVPQPDTLATSTAWVVFDRGEIPRLVSQGNTVFVDVTADWCLTCKANKALVLDREPVASVLAREDVIAMQADWTQPDPAILRYLESYDRFGIPFNIVYGPNAPEGVLLSELLSTSEVLAAIEQADLD